MSFLDIEKTNPVCVLGSGAKQALFDFTDPVGETITLNGQPFLVVGYYESMDIEYWPELDNVIVIPYTFNRTMNNNNTISSYVVKAKSASATIEAMTKLDAYLAGLFPKNEQGWSEKGDYYVQSNNSSAQELENQNLMQSLVLGAIAGISLLVGGIGIMNIMLVSVTERTREIGIRKALGAKEGAIMRQFVIEAATTSALGGVLGILLGFGLSSVATVVITNLMEAKLTVSPSLGAVLLAFGVSTGIGIIFGYLPAKKAARLNPIEALRYD